MTNYIADNFVPAEFAKEFLKDYPGSLHNVGELSLLLGIVYEKGLESAGLMWGKDMDTFAILRRLNVSRVPRFGHGDIKAPHGWGPMQWGCAIAGEVGELCNILKKYERQMPSDPKCDELEGMIQDEIADVVIYLDLLAALYEFDMRRTVARKFNRTSRKFGFPEMFPRES